MKTLKFILFTCTIFLFQNCSVLDNSVTIELCDECNSFVIIEDQNGSTSEDNRLIVPDLGYLKTKFDLDYFAVNHSVKFSHKGETINGDQVVYLYRATTCDDNFIQYIYGAIKFTDETEQFKNNVFKKNYSKCEF